MRALIVGATGFIGRRLAERLLEDGGEVTCMVRSRESDEARALDASGCELRQGDLTEPDTLAGAVDGVEVVYYLAHLMSGDGDDLVEVEESAAQDFGAVAKGAGVERIVYLGGLGDPDASEHLTARHRTALALAESGPPLTYFRAAMVVGAGSGSYDLLRSIVERLPVILTPAWLDKRTQPIGVDAVVEYLAQAPGIPATAGRQIEIGGPETMTYSEMLEGMASALGIDGPRRLPTPPGIPAAAVAGLAGVVTRGEPEVAERIAPGLATDTVVEDPSGMELFEIEPASYRRTLLRSIEDDFRAEEAEPV